MSEANTQVNVDPPIWMRGVWSRDWIEKRGVKSDTVEVHYLQSPTFFADMRIPRNRLAMVGATSFGDLTEEQLRSLARQNGFTGRTTRDPRAFWSALVRPNARP